MKNLLKRLFKIFHFEIRKIISEKEKKRLQERHTFQNLLDENKWLIQRNIRAIIDIGANEGQFALKMRQLMPLVKIISFEPIPQVFEALNQKFLNDKLFTSFNCALGEEDGEIPMWLNEYSPSSSLLKMEEHLNHFEIAREQTPINVKMCQLDKVMKSISIEDPYLVKIDVQGFEGHVIKGGPNIIKNASLLIIEVSYSKLYENQILFDEIYSLLRSFGFTYAGNYEQLHSPIDHKVLQSDAIFINDKKA